MSALKPPRFEDETAVIPISMLILRLCVAMFLGGVLGWERRRRGKAAGVRTHMLVALAAAFFMIISVEFPYSHKWADPRVTRGLDASRIAAGVVMGMGFIGAGVIFRRDGAVHGLTTAADLWLVTSLGLAAGAGLFLHATLATALALFVLVGLRLISGNRNNRGRRRRRILLEFDQAQVPRDQLDERLRRAGVVLERADYDCDLSANSIRLFGRIGYPGTLDETAVLAALRELPNLRRVSIGQLRGRN